MERETTSWHTLDAQDALGRLDSAPQGLESAEAEERQHRYGPNSLPTKAARPLWLRFLAQFHNVLIYVLIVAATLAAALGHWIDAGVIAAVVLVNAIIGLVQEGKAEKAMDAIGQMLALRAKVRRDGKWRTIPAEDLVPGDIVELQAGDRIPADLRLIEAHGLRVDQAALTGESVPVSRTREAVDEEAALADRRGMAYSGTIVTGGKAIGVVTTIGSETELGKISVMLEGVEKLTTPLLRQINHFGHILTITLIAFTAVVVGLALVVHDISVEEGFLAGVALIVAAIPEGLPAIISITLAVGVQRMAGRNAIVRLLPAVETLGSVTTICSDKTGTLTRNILKAARVVIAGDDRDAEEPAGDNPIVRAVAEAAVLCNDAEPDSEEGDPIEKALLALAEPAGIDIEQLRESNPRRAVLPFSSEHKFMATAHERRLIAKGAPETILARCNGQLGEDGREALDQAWWDSELERLAADGLRVLALAEERDAPDPGDSFEPDDIDAKLCLLGLVAFEDPPRDQVPAAIVACHRAGITVKMITGDHAATASAIARKLGIEGNASTLTGPELERLDDATLIDRVGATNVYARTSPEHKLRLVKALQAHDEVVAMTGDGANDAPALKRADIGVAMGIKGTEASRQAAEMVLGDDNFASIASGIEEGRGVYDNIRKAILFILPTNAAEGLVIALAVMAGFVLPITPVQILWVNMATAVTLALALAFEPTEGEVMERPPRPPEEGLITRFVALRILWVGVVLTGLTFALFHWSMTGNGDEALARTLAVNLLVAGEIVYLFNCRRWLAPSLTFEALLANRWAWLLVGILLVMQAGFTYLPAAQLVFGTTGLGARHWLLIAVLVLPLLLLVEAEKWLWRRRKEPRASTG
ncbi:MULTISPECIES: HAD-IC family P-type ATPase [unclassified Wenzhouxiangella]|uniref:cation-translocating P-type ATPase n=1 Tax=unclassified Wenzhouxiangella TaxID=2613841 RepID=UPI000E32BC61|nr:MULTISPECIES: HAD-IC family P-type ATPase [unclassified Wenzhouxiangella]RFF26388.1 HAD family hydrolase [Wenzhouxiangella sp. 15181]RFP67340.1 HAD family hydrolase [Wenzhouxiangella sp. 15190]